MFFVTSTIARICAFALTLTAAASLLLAGTTDAAAAEANGIVAIGAAPFDPFDPVFRARVRDLAVHADDLRIRILYSTELTSGPDGQFVSNDLIDRDALADQARGSTDPLVLALLLARCRPMHAPDSRCNAVDIARRWTVADTQNQVAWIALAQALHDAGDVGGARDAFDRAARASTWREPYLPTARLLADWMSRPPLGLRRRDADLLALSNATSAMPPYQTVPSACSGAPERRDACARIIQTMGRDADTAMSLGVAAAYAARSSLPDATVQAVRTESDAVRWGMDLASPAVGPDGQPRIESDDAYLEALATIGERRLGHRLLMQAGVDDSTAASRYVASLSDGQRAARSKAVQAFESMPRKEGW